MNLGERSPYNNVKFEMKCHAALVLIPLSNLEINLAHLTPSFLASAERDTTQPSEDDKTTIARTFEDLDGRGAPSRNRLSLGPPARSTSVPSYRHHVWWQRERHHPPHLEVHFLGQIDGGVRGIGGHPGQGRARSGGT